MLTAYMARTGIGDAELARRIPVSRPTLLRWKEGVTARPRYREDVMRCAELLRLTDEERDELLLAAGFSPETVAAQTAQTSEVVDQTPPVSVPEFRPIRRGFPKVWLAVALVGVIAVGASVLWFLFGESTDYPAAVEGESLVVLAPFVNYTAGGQGFNIVGRLQDAIDDEVRDAGLSSIRTVEWPEEVDGESAAEDAIRRSSAALVIWGEYDSGRVIARFTAPSSRTAPRAQQVVDIASSPVELPTTINIGLTNEVRYVALVTLGQLYLEQDEFDRAKTVLIRAFDSPPPEEAALTNLRFLLGRAYLGGELVDLDEAVWLFTQVLASESQSVEALNSRGLAYLDRGRAGDLDLAVTDLTRAATIRPERSAIHLNLAVAYMERGAPGDTDRALTSLSEALSLQPDYAGAYVNRAGVYIARGAPGDIDMAFDDLAEALELEPGMASAYLNRGNAYLARGAAGDMGLAIGEFSRSIELSPDLAVAYFNRGLVHSERGDLNASLVDLRNAQELSPNDSTYNSILCWQLAVAGIPQEALPYCELAVASDPEGIARDSRGLANALTGRTEQAIADFEAFQALVDSSPKQGCGARYGNSRESWVEELKAGDHPFDSTTLYELRARPILPGGDPC